MRNYSMEKTFNDPVSVVPKGQNLNWETLSSASDKHKWLLVRYSFPMWDLPLGTGGAKSWNLALSQLGLGTGCLPWPFPYVDNITGLSEVFEDQSVEACVWIFEILKCLNIFNLIFFHHHLTDICNLIFLKVNLISIKLLILQKITIFPVFCVPVFTYHEPTEQADVIKTTAARKRHTFPIPMLKILPAKHRQQMGRDLMPLVSQISEWKAICHDYESIWIELPAASTENGRWVMPERK